MHSVKGRQADALMTPSKLSLAVGKHEPGKAGTWQTVYLLKPESNWESWSVSGAAGRIATPANLRQDWAVQLTLNLFLILLSELTAFPELCGKETQK